MLDNDHLLLAIKDMFDKKVDEVKSEVVEVKSHMGILVEKLQADIKTIAEGHSTLDRKIEDTGYEIKEELSSLKKDMTTIKDYIISVDEKLNEHEVILKRAK